MSTNVDIDAESYIYYYKSLFALKTISKYYRSYLEHVLRHRYLVYIAWIYIADTLCSLGFINESDMDAIDNLIKSHDDSKLQEDEIIPYAKKFAKHIQIKKRPEIKENFKVAVILHKERNLHHYEALKSYKGKDWKHYAVELICDYIAMGWEFDNYVCEYFQRVKDELKSALPEEYYNYIERIICIIPEKLALAEEPLTENNIDYIYYRFNYFNDPFEDRDPGSGQQVIGKRKTRLF